MPSSLSTRHCALCLLLQLCLTLVPRSNAVKTSTVNFLRAVVAPVEVPGLSSSGDNTEDSVEEVQPIRKLTSEELKEERKRLEKLRAQRRARAEQNAPQPDPARMERMPEEHIRRELSWFKNSGSASMHSESALVDPSKEYDKWAQAYRYLGGYIDCDHPWEQDDKNKNKNNDKNNNYNNQRADGENACSRWGIFATYVNPNYQGNEYAEYFTKDGSEPPGKLDCHSPDTSWKLLGVFRQEHYQYLEQISKHLWAINDYEYVVALAGLAYMTKYECYKVGQSNDGSYLYVAVEPTAGGDQQVALYTDDVCLTKDTSSGFTPSSFGLTNDVNLGSKDQEEDDSYADSYWSAAQEDTLTNMNEVYKPFKYCTSCVDYPTYQDGYFIGDYGTDDDDLINQCWKFWSHDAYICEHDCLSKASAQGTINQINYGSYSYGTVSSSFYQQEASSTSSTSSSIESPLARLLSNAFVTLAFLLFVATFLAFAVARRSRYRESRSSRSRRLLDSGDDAVSKRSASQRRRSKSREAGADGRDGLFRDSNRRSKSRTRGTSSSRRTTPKYNPDE